VDSTESQGTGVLALIQNGFLAQEDWDIFQQNSKKKFSLERLVHEGLVSPHAVGVAKHEQILYDLKAICSADTMQVNFVPQEEGDEPPKHAVSMKQLMRLLASSMEEIFPEAYLKDFYSIVMRSPMKLAVSAEDMQAVWGSKVFAPLTGLRSAVEGGQTLEDAAKVHKDKMLQLLHCVHYLVLSRNVIFDDVQHSKELVKLMERYTQLFNELNGKSPDQVFVYFYGSADRPTPSQVQRMFEDYEKGNAPNQLPKDASPELIDMCRKCYELVLAAKEVMTDEHKRAALYETIKQGNKDKSKKANELVAQGLEFLKKGQFDKSLEILKQAETNHPSSLQITIMIWAQVKGGVLSKKPELQATAKRLEDLPAEDRKSTYWLMAMGLVKKAMGDASAAGYFEKIAQIDNTFVEARRELNSMNSTGSKEMKLNDLLTGDITTVVSQLFRSKTK
jgi:hypothetical protein